MLRKLVLKVNVWRMARRHPDVCRLLLRKLPKQIMQLTERGKSLLSYMSYMLLLAASLASCELLHLAHGHRIAKLPDVEAGTGSLSVVLGSCWLPTRCVRLGSSH